MKIQGTDPSGSTQFRQSSPGPQIQQKFPKVVEAINNPEKKPENKPSQQQLEQAVDQLNKTMMTYNTELRFKLHKESQEMQVSVINTNTKEVIRKIPPDKILNIVAHVKEMLGLIVNELI